MNIHPGEHAQIARLLHILAHGERMAQTCAARQADLAPQTEVTRFLRLQSRQEAAHARLFNAGAIWLGGGHASRPFIPPAMVRYENDLTTALDSGSLAETLLAQQVIMEGLGEIVLANIAAGVRRRHGILHRLHHTLLRQEETHLAFGRLQINNMLSSGQISRDVLQQQASHYLALAEGLLDELQEMFDFFNENTAQYKAALRSSIASALAA